MLQINGGVGLRKKTLRFGVIFALIFSLCVCFGSALNVGAAESATVTSDEQLLSALSNAQVDSIIINYQNPGLSSNVTISRQLAITASGAELTFTGGSLIVAPGGNLTLTNIRLKSDSDFAVFASGNVTLGASVGITGSYGILLSSGGSLSGGGNSVSAAQSVKQAVAVNASSGECSISDITLTGSGTLVHLNQSPGRLNLSGTVTLRTDKGDAIICPTGGVCPDVALKDNAVITLDAPGSAYAALDIRSSSLYIGSMVTLEARGGSVALYAAGVSSGTGAKLNLSCAVKSAAHKDSLGALTCFGNVSIGENSTVTIGSAAQSVGSGIFCAGTFTMGKASSFIMRSAGEGGFGICSFSPITFVEDASVYMQNVPNGIVCSKGITFGNRCTTEITDSSGFAVKALGELIEDKISFGEDNTIKLSSTYCAIYTREALEIGSGCTASIASGAQAPALWVDTSAETQGHLTIINSAVNITSNVGPGAVLNSAVYVVGAITVEQASEVSVNCGGDFGMISVAGDINISSDANLYTSGNCGMYLKGGNLRLTSGGSLFAEGLLDSGVRVEHGVLSVGVQSSIDAQGARFGVEMLGTGGVWLTGAKKIDIRSLTDRAIFIQNGSFNVEQIERLSAWDRSVDGNNAAKWWSGSTSGMRSWDITTALPVEEQLYADHTMLTPVGSQDFSNGMEAPSETLKWHDGSWNLADYSRIGMSYTKPFARANSFNIPAGKSFSWWLYGSSYNGYVSKFSLIESIGEGEFSLNENGRFTYTAQSYTRGVQSFKFVVYDLDGISSEPASINILVTASKPPTAYSMSFETAQGESITSNVTVRDYDGTISDVVAVTQPEHGTLTLASDGAFKYTPNTAYTGFDCFSYYAEDNVGDKSSVAYVSFFIGMDKFPVAYNSTFITQRDEPYTGSIEVRLVKSAETDGGEPADTPSSLASVTVTEQPVYGVLEMSPTGDVVYTPYEDFAGSDFFKYIAYTSDGIATNEATVTIVTVPSQKPIAESASLSAVRNSQCKASLVADDLDGHITKYTVTSSPENGSIELDESTGSFVYKPNNGFTGEDHFCFVVTDNEGFESKEATITIRVRTLADHLRATGEFGKMFILAIVLLLSLIAIIVLVAVRISRKKKEKEYEQKLEAMLYNASDSGIRNDRLV